MKKNHLEAAAASTLFRGVEKSEIEAMLKCLDARFCSFKKGETVYSVDDKVSDLGLVVKGSLFLTRPDYRGNMMLLEREEEGDLFGEIAACLGDGRSDVDVVAAEPADVLFLNVARVLKTCSSACVFHQRMIRNLLYGIAEKNQQLNHKVEHISKRTTKEKLLSYLTSYCGENETDWFSIPLNRQQLADYLCVDRSAMSWELCRMRDDGILEFQRNRFRFLFPLSCGKMDM
ncbi:MAG: Crp/Fnr family transcriptional regulator [Firmicutes bacterium]|nr:Crp/Fnr family transcriptional regulator [Bacillota bacterium]